MANENLYTNLEQLELLAQRTKDAIPVNVSDLENDSGYQTAAQVEAAINEKISSVFDYKGSITFAELLPALLIADNVGDVYNISDAFTTTADFIEGAGTKHPAGSNVVIVKTGTDDSPVYKFDVMGGDFSGYAALVSNATNGNLAGVDANGQYTDSGIAASSVMQKATSAVSSNVASFDANGNAVDSGIASANVMQKVASATANNIAALDANGNVIDSGARLATNTEVTTMLDRVFGASSGN